MGKPKSPDPVKTGEMQTATNIGTAVANSYLGNVNQKTPDGSLTYSQTGTTKWIDPVSKKEYEIPTFTATQTLSDQQQKIKNQTDGASLNLATLAKNQSGRLDSLLSKPFTLKGAPAGGKASSLGLPAYSMIAQGPQLQTEIGDAGDITRSYGTDYAANVKNVEEALMQRQDPYLERDRKALEQRLADQGVSRGSQAWRSAMDDASRARNDARLGAVINAGQEQNRLAGLERDRAIFENDAQGQAFQQEAARAQFGNASEQQMADNAYRRRTTNNATRDQLFNAQLAKMNAADQDRQQWIQEKFAVRNQPLNEISALLSGGQVTSPQFMNIQGQKIPTTDYAGLIMQDYANRSANWQSGAGGLLGIGASLIGLSDRRTKTDIEKVGNAKGHKLYSYRYKFEHPDAPKTVGVMAQEVEKKVPEAVKKVDGIRFVDYGRLFDMGRERMAA